MDVRALVFGSERGAALAVVVTFLVTGLVVLVRPPVDLSLPAVPAGYAALALLSALPAAIVGGYGGGLVPAWVTTAVPAGLLWWLNPEPASDPILYASTGNRLLGVLLIAGLIALVAGTLGFAVGRLVGVAWARHTGVSA